MKVINGGALAAHLSVGKLKLPHLILIYGPDGVGKSSFGASAPNPVFVGSELGTANLDVSRMSVKTWEDALAKTDLLIGEPHSFKTIVFDSLDWFEPLIWEHVCRVNEVKSIEDVGGGYGKGYVAAKEEWRKFVDRIRSLRSKGLNVILIAHSHVKVFQDPQHNVGYDRYQLNLNDKAAALFREHVDSVLFANYETFAKTEKSSKKAKAYGDGSRVMYTERRPAFDAKNRENLPFQLPLSWDDYTRAIDEKLGEKPEALIESIQGLMKDVPAGALKTNVENKLKEIGNDASKLLILKNKVLTAVGAA